MAVPTDLKVAEEQPIVPSISVSAQVERLQVADQDRVELLRLLVKAQEDERQRIARELHDQLGQLLAALSFGLQTLGAMDGVTSTIFKQVQNLQVLADEIAKEVHDLAVELRPAALDDLGLSAAVHQFVNLWSSRSKIRADVQLVGMDRGRLPQNLETIIYRIVQEALTNVAKHAHARHVSIIIQQRPDYFTLIVEDDGIGFNANLLEYSVANEQLGLLGMRERLAAVGGTLEIETTLAHGTTLFVRVPAEATRGL